MSELITGYEQWCSDAVKRYAERLHEDRWDYNASELSEADSYDQIEEIFKRHELWAAREVQLMRGRMKSTAAKLRYLISKLKELPATEGESSYVYLMQSSQLNRVKIGISRAPDERLKQVQTGCPENVEILAAAASPVASQIESALHRVFKKKRTSGEWFCLDADEIDGVVSFLGSIEGIGGNQ